MAKKKTAKQKEFDILLKYGDKPDELTKRIRTDDLDLIRKYKDKLQWYNIVNRKTLTNEFIDEFWDEMLPSIQKIEVHPNIHLDFLDRNREYIDWQRFIWSSSGSRFSIDFINKFREELEPYRNQVINLKNLPKETRDYLIEKVDDRELIQSLSHNSSISKANIEKYKDKLDWNILSKRATALLTPSVFETYKDYINFYMFTSLSETYPYYGDYMVNRIKFIINRHRILKIIKIKSN